MTTEPKLIRNSIQTPDGTILESHYRHDYKTHVDANGETYMVDGGIDYIRRSENVIPAKDLSVYSDDNHEKIRGAFSWGTYGKDGDQPLKRVLLMDLSDDHITNIMNTQDMPKHLSKVFRDEIEFRQLYDIEVSD